MGDAEEWSAERAAQRSAHLSRQRQSGLGKFCGLLACGAGSGAGGGAAGRKSSRVGGTGDPSLRRQATDDASQYDDDNDSEDDGALFDDALGDMVRAESHAPLGEDDTELQQSMRSKTLAKYEKALLSNHHHAAHKDHPEDEWSARNMLRREEKELSAPVLRKQRLKRAATLKHNFFDNGSLLSLEAEEEAERELARSASRADDDDDAASLALAKRLQLEEEAEAKGEAFNYDLLEASLDGTLGSLLSRRAGLSEEERVNVEHEKGEFWFVNNLQGYKTAGLLEVE